MKHGTEKGGRAIRRTGRLLLIIPWALLLGFSAPPARAAEPSIDIEKRAETLQREAYYDFFLGDYLTSATRLKLLEQSAEKDGKVLNDTRLLLGGLYIAWGMYRPAAALFDRWVEQFPPGSSRNQLLLLIERLQYQRALYQSAIDTFKRLSPDSAFALMDQACYLAGMSDYLQGSVPEGIGVLESVPPSSGYFPFAQLAVAQSYVQLKDFEKSIALLKKLIATDHRGDPVLGAFAEKTRLILGLLLIELGRFQEARPVLASIPSASPFYPDALFGAGWADFDAGRYSEALPYFQELSEAYPDHVYALEGLNTIGGSYRKLGAFAKALQSYGKALDVYERKGKEIHEIRTLIQDRERLADWLGRPEDPQEDRLIPFLDEDLLRFRIDRYRELSSLAAYLDRKAADMGVFEIMVDHREEVFRGHLPTLRGFLDNDPVKALQEQERLLQARLQEATRTERVEALATTKEREKLDQLARAQSQGRELLEAVGRMGAASPDLQELKGQIEAANRRLALFRGELLWRVVTEAPGRIDDLQRSEAQLREGLDALSGRRARLTASAPTLENDLERFRERIRTARQSLLEEKETALDLQRKLLPPLQVLLLQALDKQQGRIEHLAAVAKLSRIQILDLKSRP
ncbi:MAG TPA: tetratricopeptide repeat protein [Nitrospiria bacterium]|nr:tetratricopeptide repeat protein [Nitrospiria bacterium]